MVGSIASRDDKGVKDTAELPNKLDEEGQDAKRKAVAERINQVVDHLGTCTIP
jgi:hypothetical protein